MAAARTFLAFVAWVLFAGLPAHAQDRAEPAAALQGMDVVSYFKEGGPAKGQASLRHDLTAPATCFPARRTGRPSSLTRIATCRSSAACARPGYP